MKKSILTVIACVFASLVMAQKSGPVLTIEKDKDASCMGEPIKGETQPWANANKK